ncbi:TatD family hydrolase [Agriterribacter sp.]|uniref:TatD family hydrolase n=1 Tax=Agriterribacter sp. TaxID=2821509 RepID=UPI002BDF6AEF|nr:TatD family hydrolase [Agriterribacter sp.]HRP57597.1 TatD family hydrolase [Agriterribacter sp.]
MTIIDTHCHLYLEEFENDIEQVIANAQHESVQQFYLPNIDSSSIESMLQLEAKYPGVCIPMMGLHPCSVGANYNEELQTVESWLQKRRFAAVGEIGLDFYWDRTFEIQQYEAFRRQTELALQYRLPIVIHTRNAMQQCIDVVAEYAGSGLKGIFHCFGGTLQEAEKITGLGFYLGIGGVLTYKKSGLPAVLDHISLDHLVLETDAPYLAPVPKRGKRNESAYLKYIIAALAGIKNTTPEEIARITSANATFVFQNNS